MQDSNDDINEMQPEFLGLHALNSCALYNSSSRGAMFASQFSQKLTLDHPDEPILIAGPEMELAKTTFATKMPEDGKILKFIQRYPKGVGAGSIDFNPETIVIYEKESNGEIDYFSISHHVSYHQVFGFKNVENADNINKLRPGAFFKKDTVFADSPGVKESETCSRLLDKNEYNQYRSYNYGLNLNVAFMSHPAVSEDGVIISRDVLDKFKSRTYDKRTVDFGSKEFALNLYGTIDNYKSFPDIGDYIRDDGILMMLRNYDIDTVPVSMNVYDVKEPDFLFDKSVYVRGAKGRVVDIKVYKNNSSIRHLPNGMDQQLVKYNQALTMFHQEIVDTEKTLRRERMKMFGTDALQLSPKLNRLVVFSLAVIGEKIRADPSKTTNPNRQTLNLLYRKDPIDEYRVEFIIEYELIPDLGYKISDNHGGIQ